MSPRPYKGKNKIIPTERQKKVVELIVKNGKTKGKTRPLKELLKEAGYSEAQSTNPKQIMELAGVKQGLKPYLDQLERVRNKAIECITDLKLKDSKPRDLAYVTETMTKQHQLLSGKETEIVKHDITGMEIK